MANCEQARYYKTWVDEKVKWVRAYPVGVLRVLFLAPLVPVVLFVIVLVAFFVISLVFLRKGTL